MESTASNSSNQSDSFFIGNTSSSAPRPGPIGMQTYELINLCVGALLFTISLAGLAIALAKRSFPPIKAKSPHLVALALLANIAFWIGKLHAHGFLGYEGILQNCTLWGIWLQCVLGVCLMNAVLSLRYQRLYTVLILRQSAWNLRTYLPSIIYAFVVLVCAILSSAMPQKMGFYWDDESNNCFSTIASMYLFLPCVIIGVTTLAVLTWRLRRVRDAFNEYRETRYGVILLLVAFAINTILMATGYGRYRWAKHILVVISFLWGNLYFWMVMGKPIYGYLFDRNRCQERFVAGLEIDTCQYMEYTRNKSDSKTKMVSQSRYFDLDIRKNSQAHSVNPRSMHSQQHRVTRKTTNYGWDSPTDRSDHCVEEDEEGTATGRYVPPLPLSAYPMHTIPAKHQNNSGEDVEHVPVGEPPLPQQQSLSANGDDNGGDAAAAITILPSPPAPSHWSSSITRTAHNSTTSLASPSSSTNHYHETGETYNNNTANGNARQSPLFPSHHEHWDAVPYSQ